MATIQKITPCFWFDTQAKEAAEFYVSVFENSRILRILHYTEAGYDIHGKPAGTVLTVEFEISGQRFTALNGGPAFKFNEAISLEVNCETQDEIDYYWEKLSNGGEQSNCGWLKDRYGLSWQVTPILLAEMLNDPDKNKCMRVTNAFLQMKKLDIDELEKAFNGKITS
jgi:predicted 3-demethylubiquinone-9 3-methyltransferase (glyoxalase superfamily)